VREDEEEQQLTRRCLEKHRNHPECRQRAERELLEAKEALERRTEELEQQREWLEVTLASIGDAVITTDVQGRVTFLNPIAESMTGWPNDEARGQPLERVFQIFNDTQYTSVAFGACCEAVGLERRWARSEIAMTRDVRELLRDAGVRAI
jgi:PAS domain-containing protein